MLRTDDIYEEIIREHIFYSKNYMKPLDSALYHSQGVNLECGDDINIHISMHENVIHDVSFDGKCCSIVKASASLMSEELKGKSQNEALNLFNKIEQLALANSDYDGIFELLMNHLFEVTSKKQMHGTNTCVMLPWKTMVNAIQSSKLSAQTYN